MAPDSNSAELEWVRQARSSVQEARRLLAAPNARTVEESASHICRAVDSLEALQNSVRAERKPAPGLVSALTELRKDVSRTSKLLEHAANFYLGWARFLYAAACGYTARGEPASPGPVRRISVEG